MGILPGRLIGKPQHHIDAAIVIGVFFTRDEKIKDACIAYCNSLGYKYAGNISLVSLGEITKKFGAIKYKLAREEAMVFLGDFLRKKSVKICYLEEADIDLTKELKRMNYRCDIPELLSLAVAIRSKATVFMTLDDCMLESEKFIAEIRNKYGISVQKPR
ncbi:MAG: hypothetical protein HYW25_04920 [Candidatus Aenigmarchaeota archaeon]|nr:hypothetical protein [Candidatus Aenigmarchaeota archaeon]